MDKNQRINCDITTCTHNNVQDCVCNLDCIKVCSQGAFTVENKEQSMCQNYDCCE